jgi:hypothetical protein
MTSNFDERESIVREITNRRGWELLGKKVLVNSIDIQYLVRTEAGLEARIIDSRLFGLKTAARFNRAAARYHASAAKQPGQAARPGSH